MKNTVDAEIRNGNLVRAHELCLRALQENPDDARLKHAAVICLLRSGAIDRARREFREYGLHQAELDEDLMALDARLVKAMAFEAVSEHFQPLARQSALRYGAVFEATGGSYTGVNAASMMALSGDGNQAREYARRVLSSGEVQAGNPQARYYQLASTAEAHLLLGDLRAAQVALNAALAEDPENYGAHAVTRRQLALVGSAMGLSAQSLPLPVLPRPFHYAGHIFSEVAELLPAGGESNSLAGRIEQALEQHNTGAAFGALAAGADILFAEAVLRRGASLTVVLPVPVDVFLQSSVQPFGREWVRRCEHCLGEADDILETSSDRVLISGASINLASSIAMGLARLRAEMLATEPVQLLVLDPSDPAREFGTARDGDIWLGADLQQSLIEVRRERSSARPKRPLEAEASDYRPAMRAMLFADVVGSSRIAEDTVPSFVEAVLKPMAMAARATSPAYLDSWGDGLFLAYSGSCEAAEAASQLMQAFKAIDLTELDLPDQLDLRIGLHFGPAHQGRDPLMDRDSLFGAQVSLAARIESTAMPGTIFASEAFAAVLAMEQDGGFRCEPVGLKRVDPQLPPVRLYTLRKVAPDSLVARAFRSSHGILETA
ncbi:adenylate/guanylate cyclase domain-containing protein [Maricaulis sp.]|uniref:adenylate/guanylate cyclase domain-containing protein n=1 Tax=Maricaulis sp. TaxID=1486257 RepID=UPI001B1FCCB1|nr:adenylate/guanylate cyclase domain-containing protein [Maricaulis sp.]MBO6797678.1 tetratricopeptide repeat protein [Maricaulis sp.]